MPNTMIIILISVTSFLFAPKASDSRLQPALYPSGDSGGSGFSDDSFKGVEKVTNSPVVGSLTKSPSDTMISLSGRSLSNGSLASIERNGSKTCLIVQVHGLPNVSVESPKRDTAQQRPQTAREEPQKDKPEHFFIATPPESSTSGNSAKSSSNSTASEGVTNQSEEEKAANCLKCRRGS